jgi:hypothetical protein
VTAAAAVIRSCTTTLLMIAPLGCGSRPLPPDGGPVFTATRDVDILFVIDNSSSVRLLQTNLERNFPSFMAPFRALSGGLPNIHLAVITTDMGAGNGSAASCPQPGGDGGRFHYTAAGPCTDTTLDPGATYISNVDGVPNYAGNLDDTFTCIARVGDTGCAFDQPLASVARALGADGQPAPPENQGFLRAGAYLLIVVITDQDDCSAPSGSSLFDTTDTTLASPLGPLSGFRCNEFGHLCNGVKPPRLAPNGRAGDTVTLQDCTSAEGAGMLTPVRTLVAQLRALKEVPEQQLLVAAIVAPPAPYTVRWKDPAVPDTGPWPSISQSCASSDGSFANPAVRIAEWVSAFGSNGRSYSVCEESFAPHLQAIAERVAPLVAPPID